MKELEGGRMEVKEEGKEQDKEKRKECLERRVRRNGGTVD